MQPQRSSFQLAAAIFLLCTLTSAWPGFLPHADALIVRQDASTPAATPTPTGSPPKTTPSSDQTSTGTDAPMITGTAAQNATRTPASGNRTRTEFDPQDANGAVSMITPGPFDGTQLYKVGDFVTWVWNYTNLQGTPTAIDVLVSCSAATRTWTLTQNMTFATRVTYTWDTNNNYGTPYLVEQYTLLVHDSDTGVTAAPEPGYLGPYSGLKFGVYTPQPYVPLASGWRCVSCSGAASSMDQRALGVALATSAVTVLTFTWFVTGLCI